MTHHDVTVIIPAHNRPALLERALWSVQRQSTPAARVIVVDDHSHPPLRPSSDGRTPVEVVALEQGTGASRARNLGIDHATTTFVAFLDSDDWWSAGYLGGHLDVLGRGANVTYSAVRKVRGHRTRPGTDVGPIGDVTAAMLAGWSVSTTSSLVAPTDVAQSVRFDESLTGLQDYDFLVRLSQRATVGYAGGAVAFFDQHDGPRLTTDQRRRLAGITAVRAKHQATARALGCESEFHAFLDREYARASAEALAHAGSQTSGPKRARTLYADGLLEAGTGRTLRIGPREYAKVALGTTGLRVARRLLWSTLATQPLNPEERPPP